MIGDWGRDVEGIYSFSINATRKDEILDIIAEATTAGARLWEAPTIVLKHKTYHTLLKFYVPGENGYPIEE
jgi:hypothetical protein